MAYGSVLAERIDGAAARKARGAFFTPPVMAKFLCETLIASPSDCILEPACGEGEFIEAAARRLAVLGCRPSEADGQLLGCELHQATADAAYERLSAQGIRPKITVGDFFAQEPVALADTVAGNPPYVRYQEFSGTQRELAQRRARQQGVEISALASSWAPFLVHACGFLKCGGRLGMVLPAELLIANYAGPVRAYLLGHFSRVTLHLFDHAVFPEVEEEVILLVAEGFACSSTDAVLMVRHKGLEDLHKGRAESCAVAGEERWPLADVGMRAGSLLREVRDYVPLGDWGKVRLGCVTGANDYFCLTGHDLQELHLGPSDTVPLCPAGSRHVRLLAFGEEDLRRAEARGLATHLFYPGDDPSMEALAYIRRGVDAGVDQHYKCRTRKPWWKVPGVSACDIFVTYMNGVSPNLCSNDARLAYLNSVHGITLDVGVQRLGKVLLPILFLSTVSQLSAEVYGRAYGGGMLKLEPREAARTLVLRPDAARMLEATVGDIRGSVDSLLEAGQREQATMTVDSVLLESGMIERGLLEDARSCLYEFRTRRSNRSSKKWRADA